MSIISRIKGWFSMVFKSRAKEEFNIESVTSSAMESMINRCFAIYQGNPDWLDDDDHIKTVSFATAICSETARLTMLGTKITIDGSARATWLQKQIDNIYFKLRDWVEYGCAYGTVILKPNGNSIDLITPENFIVTDYDNSNITGIVFYDTAVDGKKYYKRLEYHRFVNGVYVITNRCYVGTTENDRGELIDIKRTPWSDLLEEVAIENVEQPLYGVLKTPHANNVDIKSPLGVPIFSGALEELEDLDVSYSRIVKEIKDSKRTVLLDSDRLLPSGGRISQTGAYFESKKVEMGLPDYVKNVYGNGKDDFYQEINPTLNTEERLKGLNAILNQIAYKVGFSNGYFVFNESTGIQTATGVEANQQRTIQYIKDCRDKLELCLDGLIYALNAFADLYGYAPVGAYEVVYDFGDITFNASEEKTRWWGYVVQAKIPFWYYLVKFEGFSENEARRLEQEAQPKTPTLFGMGA